VTLKSILDIEINDSAFKNLVALSEKYNKALEKVPGLWANATKEVEAQKKGFAMISSLLLAQSDLARHAANEQKSTNVQLERSSRFWREMSTYTKNFSTNIKEATISLIRWSGITGIVSGLIGAGGLFGIDRLAASAAAGRRSALGLGTTFGGQEAFQTGTERFVGPGFLEAVAGARFDITKSVGLLSLGVRPGGDTAELGISYLRKLKELADRTDPRLFAKTIQAYRLQGVSEFDLERLKRTRPAEFERTLATQADYARKLKIDDDTLMKWQDLTMYIDFAGKSIKHTFIQGLVPLAPGLKKLSEGIQGLISSLFGVPELKKWVDESGDALKAFAGYIGGDDFKQTVKKFGTVIDDFSTWITGKLPKTEDTEGRRIFSDKPLLDLGPFGTIDPKFTKGSWLDRATSGPINNVGNLRIPGSNIGFQQFSSPEAGVAAMARQLQLYENRDRIETLSGIIGKYAPPNENDTAAYIADVARKTGYGAGAHLNLNDPEVLARVIAAMISHEQRSGHYDKYKDAKVVVQILNNVGANTAVTVNGLKN
jgi:hypothetical protein